MYTYIKDKIDIENIIVLKLGLNFFHFDFCVFLVRVGNFFFLNVIANNLGKSLRKQYLKKNTLLFLQ